MTDTQRPETFEDAAASVRERVSQVLADIESRPVAPEPLDEATIAAIRAGRLEAALGDARARYLRTDVNPFGPAVRRAMLTMMRSGQPVASEYPGMDPEDQSVMRALSRQIGTLKGTIKELNPNDAPVTAGQNRDNAITQLAAALAAMNLAKALKAEPTSVEANPRLPAADTAFNRFVAAQRTDPVVK